MPQFPVYFNTRMFHFSQSFAGVNLTTSYVEVTPGVSRDVFLWVCFSQNGASPASIEIATGAAASEVVQFGVALQFTGMIPIRISANTRVAIRTQNGTITSGDVCISGWTVA